VIRDTRRGGATPRSSRSASGGGGVVEVYFADATTNNPLLTTDTASNARIALQYPSLLGLDPDTALPFPELASVVPTRENGGVSPDGLTYTFALRRDVRWSDGTPFTAGDVVFTYQTLARKELGSPRTAQINDRIAGVSSPDDHTVVFALCRIVAPFLVTNCAGAGYGIVPRHILGGVPIEQIKGHPFSVGDPQVSVTTGPFTFGEWVRGEGATLVKNPRYFRGEPALDRYRFRVVKDSPAVAVALQTGEADWGLVPLNLYDEMARRAQLTTTKYDGYSFEYAAFQLDPRRRPSFWIRGCAGRSPTRSIARRWRGRSTAAWRLWRGGPCRPSLSPTHASGDPPIRYDTKRPKPSWRSRWKRVPTASGQGWAAAPVHHLDECWQHDPRGASRVHAGQWRAIGVEATPRAEEWGALRHGSTRRGFRDVPDRLLLGCRPRSVADVVEPAFPPTASISASTPTRRSMPSGSGLAELDRDKRTAIYAELQDISSTMLRRSSWSSRR
jgi:hypothetical protein